MGAYEYEVPLNGEFDTASCSGESTASSITCSIFSSDHSLSPHSLTRYWAKDHPHHTNNKDALNIERWSGSSTLITMETSGSSSSPSSADNGNNNTNSPTKSSPSKKVNAWRLREQWKSRGHDSIPQVPRRLRSVRKMCNSTNNSPTKKEQNKATVPAVPPLFRNDEGSSSRWDSLPLSSEISSSNSTTSPRSGEPKFDRRKVMATTRSSSKRKIKQSVSRRKSLSPSPSSTKGKVSIMADGSVFSGINTLSSPTKRYTSNSSSRRKLLRKRHSERSIRRTFNDVLTSIVEVDNEDSFRQMSPIIENRKKNPMYERRSCPDLIDRALETVGAGRDVGTSNTNTNRRGSRRQLMMGQ